VRAIEASRRGMEMKRLLAGVAGVAAATAHETAVLIGGALSTSSAHAASPALTAKVVASARGPLSACPAPGDNCATDKAERR